jgi:hypothetical protein
LTKLFAIAIGYDEEAGSHFANVHSLTDDKIANVRSPSASRVLKEVNKLVRDKTREIKNFPLPEQSRIINPANDSVSQLVVLPNGSG